jgi:hypothetical protein
VRGRVVPFLLAVFVAAVATLFGGVAPAAAQPAPEPPAGSCSTDEWRNPAMWERCVSGLKDVTADRAQCLKAPVPSAPDSGMAGWFATPPSAELRHSARADLYTKYGYAGYSYTTYDIGCAPSTVLHPDYRFEHTVANGEFLIATSTIGAANALREKAWVPGSMWGWADPLVETATKAIYNKVFTVFGGVTLAIVGLYLLWRSRQSDMSAAMTTAGWAILVMVAVTAIAAWPTTSAHLADDTLTGSLNVVHGAIGPQEENIPPSECRNPDPNACKDLRSPAQRASDTVTEGLLYRNWIRGLLGSSDSETARRYGPILYDAKALSWDELDTSRQNAQLRQEILDRKSRNWMKVAEQIKEEDPEAYEYLTGTRGMDRIGAGFIAILAALFFALFDIVASLLVLLGFLIFRWAVVAAPILGTIGLLRPASGGVRRLANAVVAAIFNIVIFGTGAAVYLFAVSLIIKTDSLPGWLQVVLIMLTGVVGWLLLRPFRRITQLGGGRTASHGGLSVIFFKDLTKRQQQEEAAATERAGVRQPHVVVQSQLRPEARGEDTAVGGGQPRVDRPEVEAAREPAAVPDRAREWTQPDLEDEPTQYAIYRPTPREAPKPTPAPARSAESEPVRR